MSIRRRYQFQRSLPADGSFPGLTIYRTISIVAQDENVGQRTPRADLTSVAVYRPDGTAILGYGTTINGSVISASIPVPVDLGENYRAEFTWGVDGDGPGNIRVVSVFFDVVAREWISEVTHQDLEQIVPSIRLRLEKQRQLLSDAATTTWQQLAARRISDAQDHFFNWLRKLVRHTNRSAWVSLIPDNQRFDTIVAYLAVAFTFRPDIGSQGDADDYRFKLYYSRAEEEFAMMTLIEYDANGDNVVDTEEVQSPQRGMPVFEELARS